MTTATARADLSVIKARQQKTWASGDYAVVASRIEWFDADGRPILRAERFDPADLLPAPATEEN